MKGYGMGSGGEQKDIPSGQSWNDITSPAQNTLLGADTIDRRFIGNIVHVASQNLYVKIK
jgi:hypothetical protein